MVIYLEMPIDVWIHHTFEFFCGIVDIWWGFVVFAGERWRLGVMLLLLWRWKEVPRLDSIIESHNGRAMYAEELQPGYDEMIDDVIE